MKSKELHNMPNERTWHKVGQVESERNIHLDLLSIIEVEIAPDVYKKMCTRKIMAYG